MLKFQESLNYDNYDQRNDSQAEQILHAKMSGQRVSLALFFVAHIFTIIHRESRPQRTNKKLQSKYDLNMAHFIIIFIISRQIAKFIIEVVNQQNKMCVLIESSHCNVRNSLSLMYMIREEISQAENFSHVNIIT